MRRNAVLLVTVSSVAGVGGGAMAVVAGAWLLDLTGSARLAALGGLCTYAPVLAGPWLGVLLDRVSPRPMVVAVNLVLAGALLSLLAVRAPGQAWLVYATCLAYGVGHVLLDAAETVLLPRALPAALLGDVNGWRTSAQEGAKLVAPLAAVGLYAWYGGHAVAGLAAAAATLAALLY
ncbi:MAG TPA: MFS transporter, partial [Pilimelia sp.]|nr:MFS transporter [Pilimelia sp.]